MATQPSVCLALSETTGRLSFAIQVKSLQHVKYGHF